MKLNPFSWLLLWIDLAIILPYLDSFYLFVIFLSVFGFSFYIDKKQLILLLKKSKYLIISIMIMYVIMTTLQWQYAIVPAIEQIVRLISLLAGLNLVFFYNKNQLIVSIYYLFCIFYKIGFNFDQFIVRLWLTLEYVRTYHTRNDNLSHELIKNQFKSFLMSLSKSDKLTNFKPLNEHQHLELLNSEDNNNMKKASDNPEQLVNLYEASLDIRRKKFVAEHYDTADLELAKFLYSSVDKVIVLTSIAGVGWLFIKTFIGYF